MQVDLTLKAGLFSIMDYYLDDIKIARDNEQSNRSRKAAVKRVVRGSKGFFRDYMLIDDENPTYIKRYKAFALLFFPLLPLSAVASAWFIYSIVTAQTYTRFAFLICFITIDSMLLYNYGMRNVVILYIKNLIDLMASQNCSTPVVYEGITALGNSVERLYFSSDSNRRAYILNLQDGEGYQVVFQRWEKQEKRDGQDIHRFYEWTEDRCRTCVTASIKEAESAVKGNDFLGKNFNRFSETTGKLSPV